MEYANFLILIYAAWIIGFLSGLVYCKNFLYKKPKPPYGQVYYGVIEGIEYGKQKHIVVTCRWTNSNIDKYFLDNKIFFNTLEEAKAHANKLNKQ